jgi:mono/diheme cytochrome c family protein
MKPSIKLLLSAALAGLAMVAALSSCAPGAGGSGIPTPTRTMAGAIGSDYDTLAAGHQLFMTHCARCHSDRVPKAPPLNQRWHPSSLGLSLYHELSAAERYSISEYVRGVDRRFYSRGVIPDSDFTL